jgi:hypothetical protein
MPKVTISYMGRTMRHSARSKISAAKVKTLGALASNSDDEKQVLNVY